MRGAELAGLGLRGSDLYRFDVHTLNEWLSVGGDDFGHDVLPRMLAQGKTIYAYLRRMLLLSPP